MDVPRLVVTADDVGLHPSMTLAAIRAHREGIVTACSISACGTAFDDAVSQLRDVPRLDCGIHVTLVEEAPLLPPAKVGTLLGTDGRFLRSFREFVFRYARKGVRMSEVELELRAQIEKILGAGITLVHMNGHQHLHLLPQIFDLVLRLAEEYRIGYIRTVHDLGRAESLVRVIAMRQLDRFGGEARTKARARGIATNDFTIGIAEAGAVTPEKLATLISRARGVTELVAHPGLDDAELSHAYDWEYAWERETEALCSEVVRNAVANVRLMSIRELLNSEFRIQNEE